MRENRTVTRESLNRSRNFTAFIACLVIPTTFAAAHVWRGGGDDLERSATEAVPGLLDEASPPLALDYRTEVNDALGLRDHEIVTLPVFDEPGVPVRTAIPIGGEVFTLDLIPSSVRAAGYRLLVQADDGSLVEEAPGPIRTVAGRLLERPGSSVAGSVLEDGFHLVIDTGDGGPRVWVEPAAGASDQGLVDDHVMYTVDDIIASPGTCGVTGDVVDLPEVEGGEPAEGGVAGGCATPYWLTEVAIDADHEMYISLGASVAAVEAWVSNIMATTNAQYQSEVGIRHVITTIIVRASVNDPYTSTTSPGSLLNQLEGHWNSQQGGVQRDVVHMFTGRSLDNPVIGIANLSAICVLGNAYGLVENLNATLACMTDLSAHELGHNWSAGHCSCSNNTMNSSLTCANNFNNTQTVPQIIAFRNSRNCLVNQCVPENDDCVSATPVGSGSFAFSTDLTFTDGPADTLCDVNGDDQVGSDVWFRYDAECAGDVTVDVCMGATFDARLAVYEGGCPMFVNSAVACNDDSCGNRPQLTFLGQPATTYYIRVGGFQAAQGDGTLTVTGPECVPPGPNDSCGNATTVGLGTSPMTTLGGTTDGFSEPLCDGSLQILNDSWFRYFALESGDLTITADGDFDTKLAVYGSSCPSTVSQALACNDDAGGNASSVTLAVTAFQLLRIRIGSPDGSVGSGTVTLSMGPIDEPCPGDTNGDDVINIDDIVNVVLDFGCVEPPDCPNGGDVNDDDVVNIDDIVFVVLNFGNACP